MLLLIELNSGSLYVFSYSAVQAHGQIQTRGQAGQEAKTEGESRGQSCGQGIIYYLFKK